MIIFTTSLKDGKNQCLSVSNSEYNGTIYAGDRQSGKVSLMINVYWGTEYLDKILDVFKEKNTKTTFFVGGTWVKENPEMLKKMVDFGHEIASHGYSHKELGKYGYEVNASEIKNCHSAVLDTIGIKMNLLAPPGGSYNKTTISVATEYGYKVIMWTRDTIDWRDHDKNLIYSRAVTSVQSGDLILMHPTKDTLSALPEILDTIASKGLKITTVSDTLGLNC